MSCFLNALLQALYNLPRFRKELMLPRIDKGALATAASPAQIVLSAL